MDSRIDEANISRRMIQRRRIRNLLIGRSYAFALRFLRLYRIPHRVVRIDGHDLILTQDFNPNRVGLVLRTFRKFRNDEQRLEYVNRRPRRVLVANIVFG
jgi:hypothetical protein